MSETNDEDFLAECEVKAKEAKAIAEKASKEPWTPDGVKEGFRQGPWAIVAPLIQWRNEPLPDGPGILATFNGNMDKQQIALDNVFVCHARTSNPDLAARVLQLVAMVREREERIAKHNAPAPRYAQLTDWVRAQPEGTRVLAVFHSNEQIPTVSTYDNHGKRLDECYEYALHARMQANLGYSAVWLSRCVDKTCEHRVPLGISVYREGT